jgi:hypothetical protein
MALRPDSDTCITFYSNQVALIMLKFLSKFFAKIFQIVAVYTILLTLSCKNLYVVISYSRFKTVVEMVKISKFFFQNQTQWHPLKLRTKDQRKSIYT